ncbi:hypothetical protein Tco_0077642 [Tanacetum coccineum]
MIRLRRESYPFLKITCEDTEATDSVPVAGPRVHLQKALELVDALEENIKSGTNTVFQRLMEGFDYAPTSVPDEQENERPLWDSLDKDERVLSHGTNVRFRGSGVPAENLWKNLIEDATEAFRSRVAEGVSTRVEALVVCNTDSMWNTLASIIKDAVKDTLGVAMGTSKTHTARRESWWLYEEVQAIVTVKQAGSGSYSRVGRAKEKAYEDLYKKLDSKERANDIFKIAKARERIKRDIGDICFIKDEEGRTITDEEEIKKR